MHDMSAPGLTTGPLLQFSIPASYDSVRTANNAVRDALKPLDLSIEEIISVEMVIAEALNNIVEHAYPGEDEGEIRILLRQRKKGVIVEVRDDGKPMPNGRAPIGNHPITEITGRAEDLPEGGFGWFVIREIARDLIYDRADGENFLIFRLAIGDT